MEKQMLSPCATSSPGLEPRQVLYSVGWRACRRPEIHIKAGRKKVATTLGHIFTSIRCLVVKDVGDVKTGAISSDRPAYKILDILYTRYSHLKKSLLASSLFTHRLKVPTPRFSWLASTRSWREMSCFGPENDYPYSSSTLSPTRLFLLRPCHP